MKMTQEQIDEIARRNGYKVREQFASERVDTSLPAGVIQLPPDMLPPSDLARDIALRPVFEKIKRDVDTPEADILAECLSHMKRSKSVAWCNRMNTGGMKRGDQYVAFGFKGCSDIIGQHRDGRFIAVECKRPGKVPTSEQWQFLNEVARNNGIAIVATDVADVKRFFL